MNSLRCSRIAVILLLAMSLFSLAAPLAAQSTPGAGKVVSLMRACKYDFQATQSPSVWVMQSTGTHLKDMKVGVTLGADGALLVVFVTVVEKHRMPATAAFMRTLLQQDLTMDRVQIGLDGDGDLSLRIDATMRVTDAEEFKVIVEQTQSAADELYGLIEPNLLR